jgi:hypothetical protein
MAVVLALCFSAAALANGGGRGSSDPGDNSMKAYTGESWQYFDGQQRAAAAGQPVNAPQGSVCNCTVGAWETDIALTNYIHPALRPRGNLSTQPTAPRSRLLDPK